MCLFNIKKNLDIQMANRIKKFFYLKIPMVLKDPLALKVHLRDSQKE